MTAARRFPGAILEGDVTQAYAWKYDTKASEKWVRGFAEPHRCATTLELLPVQPSPAPDSSLFTTFMNRPYADGAQQDAAA
jgi:hypothetical protein